MNLTPYQRTYFTRMVILANESVRRSSGSRGGGKTYHQAINTELVRIMQNGPPNMINCQKGIGIPRSQFCTRKIKFLYWHVPCGALLPRWDTHYRRMCPVCHHVYIKPKWNRYTPMRQSGKACADK